MASRTIKALLDAIEGARKIGDHDYEDKCLLELEEAIRSKKAPRLIIYVESCPSGDRVWVDSDIQFDDVWVELSTPEVWGGKEEDATVLHEPYNIEQYQLDARTMDDRIWELRRKLTKALLEETE
jgi:hypothetical protein